MKKRVLFWILLILIIIPISYSADILLMESPLQDIIVGDNGEVQYTVLITNNQEVKDSFRFVLPSVYTGWRIENVPAQITIQSLESEDVLLKIIPTKLPLPDDYGLGIKVVSNANESQFIEHTFTFKVVTYKDAIKTKLIAPENINPNQENLIRVQLENKYDVTIKDIKLILENEYFTEEMLIALRPYETVTKDFVINFEPPVEKGLTDVKIKIQKTKDDQIVIETTETIEVGDFDIIESITSPLSEFLLKKEVITKTNNGNTISTETFTKRIGFFEKLFTKTNIDPNQVTKDGNSYLLTWEFKLEPNETRLIEIETNYRYFILALIVLAFLIYLIYRMRRRDLSISKKLTYLTRSKEGVSSMNIQLSVRNISGKTLNNIKVMDATIRTTEKPDNFGSLKPKTIQIGEFSTRMMWEIPVIRKNEEIIISYTAKSKIPLMLDVKLPPAMLKYISGKRRFIIKSNNVKLFS